MTRTEDMEDIEAGTELSDDDLDAVAGGAFVEPTIVRKPVPSGFDDPIIGTTPSIGFDDPIIAIPTPLRK